AFLNPGAGAFDPPLAAVVGVGIADCRPLGLAMADLDGDASPDLAVSANVPGANMVAVLLNAGGGSFEDPVRYEVGKEIPGHPAAADLDNDGSPEIIVTVS